MVDRVFTLEQARALLPALRDLLNAANDELVEFHGQLKDANLDFDCAEKNLLDGLPLPGRKDRNEDLPAGRAGFQQALDLLAQAQHDYIERFDYWIDRIAETGVILRDIQAGLVDFPARQGDFQYLLCWRMGEADIEFWHRHHDGFRGRKPLAALVEYL